MAKSTQDEENRKIYWELSNTLNNKNFWYYVAATAGGVFFNNKRALWNLRSAFKEAKELRRKASAAAFKKHYK